MADVLDELRQIGGLLDQAAARAAWALSDQDIVSALDAAHALEQRAAALQLACVREIDGRGLPRAHGATSTTAWLRDRLRLTPAAARRTVALAALLADAPPVIGEALAQGRITVDQCHTIAHAVTALPTMVLELSPGDGDHHDSSPVAQARHADSATLDKAADLLVEYAAQFDPTALHRLGQRILHHVAPDLADQADLAALRREERRARRRRHMTISHQPDGGIRLTGVLEAETAALLHAAIDPLSAPHGAGDDRTPGQRRHDALTEICRLALRTEELPESGGDRPQLAITIDFDTITRQLGAGTLDTGQTLTPEAVRRLACDAALLPAVLDGTGQVLDLGRQRRLITGPLRRALVLRDRGCAFPGCDRPARWCDGHHIQPWQHGGPTDLHNSVLLCGHHHRVIHTGQWEVRLAADGHPEFLPPTWLDPTRTPRRNHHHRRTRPPARPHPPPRPRTDAAVVN